MTPGQLRVLGAIADLFEDEGLFPTIREIATKLGLSSPAGICEHIAKLKAAGLVERQPRKARTLYPTTAGWELLCPAEAAAPAAPKPAAKPAVMDALELRLDQAIPGAGVRLHGPRASTSAWAVVNEHQVLATGASRREAVDRAVFLWGRR